MSRAGGLQSPTKEDLKISIAATEQQLAEQKARYDELTAHYNFLLDQKRQMTATVKQLQFVVSAQIPVDTQGAVAVMQRISSHPNMACCLNKVAPSQNLCFGCHRLLSSWYCKLFSSSCRQHHCMRWLHDGVIYYPVQQLFPPTNSPVTTLNHPHHMWSVCIFMCCICRKTRLPPGTCSKPTACTQR